eukprot:14004668-Alexandrium_andersonii.AAC.1
MAQLPTSAELQASRAGPGTSAHRVLPGTPGTSSATNPEGFTLSPMTPKTSPIPPKYLPAAKHPHVFKAPMPDASKTNINAMNFDAP